MICRRPGEPRSIDSAAKSLDCCRRVSQKHCQEARQRCKSERCPGWFLKLLSAQAMLRFGFHEFSPPSGLMANAVKLWRINQRSISLGRNHGSERVVSSTACDCPRSSTYAAAAPCPTLPSRAQFRRHQVVAPLDLTANIHSFVHACTDCPPPPMLLSFACFACDDLVLSENHVRNTPPSMVPGRRLFRHSMASIDLRVFRSQPEKR